MSDDQIQPVEDTTKPQGPPLPRPRPIPVGARVNAIQAVTAPGQPAPPSGGAVRLELHHAAGATIVFLLPDQARAIAALLNAEGRKAELMIPHVIAGPNPNGSLA